MGRSALLAVLRASALLAVLALWAAPGQAQTPTPTPGGDCCEIHAGASCDSTACTECVCDIDAPCCLVEWDDLCVEEAKEDCEQACGCTGPTPTPGGDCCSAHAGPSCDATTCRECVCGLDDDCCNNVWDSTCVSEAQEECATSCQCAPPATATPTPSPTPGGDCCTAHAGASCDDQACETCVCDLDADCCTLGWDETCADEAAVECALSCSMCGSDGDCCEPHGGVGCSEVACKDCVCDLDAACCTDGGEGWDQTCVDEATAECAASCSCEEAGSCCEEHVETVGCDVSECQECVCEIDAACCSIGWDATCADEAANECGARCTECGPSDCCSVRGEPGCDTQDCEDCVCGEDAFCCEAEGEWDGGCVDLAVQECPSQCQCEGEPTCPGDCNGNGQVSINELIIGVNIALGNAPIADCPAFDANGSGDVGINELIQAVLSALNGCPA